ncbi:MULTISPECIES: NAD(P)-dependent oxidoreductase [unclassified Saccharothrix]|uniref:NAD(P)-dependent oxidoreductase n=1 Tax=unclassified Saccharothrix TaxID=2593673 RepID=UPI00307F5B10
MTSETPVAVIGLGLMGHALAGAFLRAGHPTTVWNRTAAKADRLVAEGAKRADSVRDAVVAGSLVVVCVADHDVVRGLREQIADVLDGKVLVNMTTGTSGELREVGEWAVSRGAAALTGQIMAMPQDIGTAEALILHSGSRRAFERHEATLRGLAGSSVHLGEDHGLSALYAGAGVSLMWSVLNGFLHGAAVLGAAGVEASVFVPFARQNLTTAAGWLAGYAEQVDQRAYPALDATIESHAGAMALLVHETEALGVDAAVPKFAKALADRAVAAGRGGESYAALVELLRNP